MSTYYSNIPAAGDNPSDSQPLLQSNFQALNTAIDRNHKAMSDTANSGRHEVVEMEEQSSDPTPVSSYGSLYVKDDAGTQNLYMIDDLSAVHQFTNAFTAATAGEFIIPGGLVIKWGNQAVSDETVITYPSAFTSTTYNVQISPEKADLVDRFVYVKSGSLLAASFAVKTNSASINIFWLAIGM